MHERLRLVRVTAATAAGSQTKWDVYGNIAYYDNLADCNNLPVRGAEGSKTGGAVKGPFWESRQKPPVVRRSVALITANSREFSGFRP